MKRLGAVIFTFVSALMVALPAAAQEYPPVGEGPQIVQPVAPGIEVAPRVVERGEALAVTGADVAMWIGIGLALVALGLVLLRVRRRAAQA